MKDLIISGSTYKGVEQLFFKTASGGTARFVDADMKTRGEISCGMKSHTYGQAFSLGEIIIENSTPTATMTLEE